MHNPHELAVVRIAASLIGDELGKRVNSTVSAHKAGYLRVLHDFFSEALERGEVHGAAAKDLSLTWRSFLDGLLTDLVFRNPSQSLTPERLKRLWNIIWRGLQGLKEEKEGS